MTQHAVTPRLDAIVVGSGATGGWAAKRLAEAGLSVAMLEAGRPLGDDGYREHVPAHALKYRGLSKAPLLRTRPTQAEYYACREWNASWFVNDLEEPYTTPADQPFSWFGRMRVVGGRTNVWGRQSYRFSDADFRAASRDGVGIDWPFGYDELAPYYDLVEEYVGISGKPEGDPMIPDGRFLPPMPMTCPERAFADRIGERFGRLVTIGRVANLTRPHRGRAACHYCGPCEHGCVTHSYFNSAFTTVADAVASGRCTLITDAMVHQVVMDPDRHRAVGIRYIDRRTRKVHELKARVVILCAQMFESVRILFNSATRQAPNGLANSSGRLGRYLQVHFTGVGATADLPGFAAEPSMGAPRRPNALFVPRFRNRPGAPPYKKFLRGFGYQGGAHVDFDMDRPGFGDAYKQALRHGVTSMRLQAFGECLPDEDNRCEIDSHVVDAFGIPVLRIRMTYRENERAMLQDMADSAAEMLEGAGGTNVRTFSAPREATHEVGCARMGRDPRTSVLDPFQRTHDIDNLYVMDGSGFPSGGWSNPTLTMMALAVRSTDHLLDRMKRGEI